MPSIQKIQARLTSPSGQILCGRGIQFGSQLALVLLVPRFLDHEDFVQYSLVLPLGFLLGAIVCGWITGAICRYAHDFLAPEGVAKREATATYFFLIGLVALVAYGILHFVVHTVYAIAPLVLFSSSVKGAVLGVLNASYRPGPFLKANLLYLLPAASFLAMCGLRPFEDFESVMLAFVGLEAALGLVLAVWAGIPFWRISRFNWQALRPYLLFGGPFVINGIANWLLMLSDRYFLSMWSGTAETANYILSYQLGGSIVQYPMSFYLAVFGPMALSLEREHGLKQAMQYVYAQLRRYLALAPLALAACTTAVLAFKFLFYPKYSLDLPIVFIIVAAHLVHAGSHFFYKELELTARTLATTRAILAGAVVNVLTNLALIPDFGAHGAAVATLLGYATYTGMLVASRKHPDHWID